MRFRLLLRVLICILTPILILACSIVFTGGNFHRWMLSQRDFPLLWLVDFCAVYTLLLLVTAMSNWEKASQRQQEIIALRQENHAQWEANNARAEELGRERAALSDKVMELDARHSQETVVLEDEARHLAEYAFRAVQGQIEAQARQLEAVNLALQHHRADISQLRQAVKLTAASDTVESHFAEPAPAEYAAVAAPVPRTLSERREPMVIQPVHDAEAVSAPASPRSNIEF